MACELATIQTAACASGIGEVADKIQLLQIIAQLQGDILQLTSPAADISPAAILERACTSGIGKVDDLILLEKIIAQLLCDTV